MNSNFNENCIFCQMLANKIPYHKIYENDKVLAFLDIAGDFDGHTLVIPKKHCTNFLDADNETINAVMQAVQKISNHYIKNCGFNGVNIFNCNNESAEQSVFHLHVHIIPRKNGDNLHVCPENNHLATEELSEICKKLTIE